MKAFQMTIAGFALTLAMGCQPSQPDPDPDPEEDPPEEESFLILPFKA